MARLVDKIVLNLKLGVILTGILIFTLNHQLFSGRMDRDFPLVVVKKEGRWDVVTLQELGFPVTNKGRAGMLDCTLLLLGEKVAGFLITLLSGEPISNNCPNLEDASSKTK